MVGPVEERLGYDDKGRGCGEPHSRWLTPGTVCSMLEAAAELFLHNFHAKKLDVKSKKPI